MKTARWTILAILCAVAVTAQEQKIKKATPRVLFTPPYFYKTEEFLDLNENERTLYTGGLMDGFFASAWFGASDATVATINSCVKGMDSRQISAIITKYVKDHPESWHLPLSVEAYNALSGACPGTLKVIE